MSASPAALFATVALAHALGVASPGPDLAVVTRQTLAHGRAAGLRTAWGIASGIGFHVAYGMFGLSWAIARYPATLDLLRGLGAVLLLWIGWRAWHAPNPATPPAEAGVATAAARDYTVGLFTNLLNVKAMLFFVALCAAVISGDTPVWLRLGLGGWMIVATGLWFSFVAWTLSQAPVRARLLRVGPWLDRVMGVILLALGVSMVYALFAA